MSEQRLSEASAWKYLIETLTMLAVDARDQTAWLDKYRLETDDLAEDYENAQASTRSSPKLAVSTWRWSRASHALTRSSTR
ncbi:hypothetical protein ACFY0A_38880 [Streptomyces sp. NPDC001698]|uniref:hypothetical protein n=1 Tax=Streptomyces sp. NPDC001698 TaxID=3364601 RepID=UPI0036CD7287